MNVHVLSLSPAMTCAPRSSRRSPHCRAQHGIAAACIVSAVGSLSQAMLRYADKPGASEINGPLELLMLSGTLSPDGAHLHGSVADAHGEVRAGTSCRAASCAPRPKW